MAGRERTVQQRRDELTALRRRVDELEAAVAESQRVESELRAEIERLRVVERVIEDSPDGFAVVDRHYVYRTVNRLHEEVHGRPANQIVGRTVAELLGETAFQKTVRPNLDRCFAGEPVRYESWFTYPAGGRRYVEIRYYPLRLGATVVYVVAVTHDITDRKRAETASIKLAQEQALRQSEQHYRLLFETMLQGVVYQDAEGGITSMNPAAEQILGKSPEEFLGQTSVSVEQGKLTA